ncbi:hypothetical protein MTO96_002627 [Rhipicephalus appendiculatus]
METDQLRLSEMAYLHVPDKERSKSPSPCDSLASSATDISTLPIHDRTPHHDEHGLTRHLAFAIAAAALGSAFQHGYNTGVVNAPQKLVEEFIEDTYKHRFEEEPGEGTVKFIFSIFVAIFCVGGMMGGLLTAFVAERFGRKGGLLLNNISVFIAAILMGSSKSARSYEMLILGRFFVGLSSGLNAGLAPIQILGLPSALGTADRWPALFAMTVVPSLFMLATLPLCPESPKYILINQGRDVAAQQALTWLRGTIEVHDEMDEMRAEFEAIKMVSRVTLYEMMHNITLRIPLLISIMVMLSQQLSGINAAIFFSTDIFRSAGLNDEVAMQATLGMGAVNVLMTIVSLVLVERAGRRTLHLVGLGGMAVITVILTICLALSDSVPGLSYVSIVAVIGFVVMFATGPGSIPWFLVGELFGQGARPLATSIAVAVNWSANFLVGLAFLPLTGVLEHYTFLIFTALLVFFWLFTYYMVPETKNKSVEEIAALFRQRAYH